MSVYTIADEKIESIKDNMDSAIKDLAIIMIDKVDGYDDFNETYQETLTEVMHKLIKLRRTF